MAEDERDRDVFTACFGKASLPARGTKDYCSASSIHSRKARNSFRA